MEIGPDLHLSTTLTPASRIRPIDATLRPLLLWACDGSATVDVAGEQHTLHRGHALLVPKGSALAAVTTPGSVVVPIEFRTSEVPESVEQTVMLRIPPGWDDWLVYRYARYLGWAYGAEPDGWSPVSFVGDRPVESNRRGGGIVQPPPLPRSAAARVAAVLLLHEHRVRYTAAELAARVGVGTRTLQRHFIAETGLAVGRWHRASKLAAAASYLAAGHDIGWTAHRIGFANVSAFSHAFRAHVGESPGRFATAASAPSTAHPADSEPIRDDLHHLVAAQGGARPVPPIPAANPFWSVDLYELAVWVYRGTATITVPGRDFDLRQGDTMWLPAGLPNRVDVAEGSIMLPLGRRHLIRPTPPEALAVVSMPDDSRDVLLHTVVSNHSWLRPVGHDDTAIIDMIRARQLRTEELRGTAASPAVDAVMSAFTRAPADQTSLSEFAHRLGVDPDQLHAQFKALTGTSFPRWRGRMRMTLARDLLWAGHRPKTVARRLGYAHLSGFNKVFKAANGMSPSHFCRIEGR